MKQSSHRQAVLFDFDGTLGRSLHHWAEAYRGALSEHGVSMEYTEARRACFSSAHSTGAHLNEIKDRNAFKELVWERVLGRMSLVDTYPDVVETLQQLRSRSFSTGVVTNSRRGHVHPVLQRWDLVHSFDVMIAIEDVSKGKPDPEAIHQALEQLKIPTASAWMIGDSLADIDAGNAAGLRTIAFSPPENHEFAKPEDLRAAKPTHVAHSYREVQHIILTATPIKSQDQ